MRVDKATYRSLVDMLAARRPGLDEVEAVYVTPAGSEGGEYAIQRDSAKRLLAYLTDPSNGYAASPGSPSDTLDVSVPGGCRYTYSGASIAALSTPAAGPIVPGQDGQRVTVMRKERVRPSVGLPDYRLRVNMKSERTLEGMDAATALADPLLTGPTRGAARVYRRKLRYSFEPVDPGGAGGGCRIDVTAVRQLKQAERGDAPPTMKQVASRRETYEVEVEVEVVGVDADELLSHFGTMLAVIDDTDAEVLSVSERAAVLREYGTLVGGGPKRFAGPKPVSLELAHLACAMPGMQTLSCATRDYTVTDKADGERRLLFVSAVDRRAYTINERLAVRATGLVAKRLSGCLLDGEHLPDRFLAFDALFVAGRDVRELPLMAPAPTATEPARSSRRKSVKDDGDDADGRRPAAFRDRLEAARRVVGDLQNLADDGEGYSASVKEFRRIDDRPSFAEACRHVLIKRDSGRLPYRIDGLILTPALARMPAGGGRWDAALKWKPPDQNTIDFKVSLRASGDDGLRASPSSGFYQVADLLVGQDPWLAEKITALDYLSGRAAERLARLQRRPPGAPAAYDSVPFSPVRAVGGAPAQECFLPRHPKLGLRCRNGEEIVDGLVVEFSYDLRASDGSPPQARWTPLRVRWDKTTPNNAATAEGVWGTILTPVTEEMMTSAEALDAALKEHNASAEGGQQSSYYVSRLTANEGDTGGLRRFHNNWVKREALLMRFPASAGLGRSIFDFGCGRGGDLSKWIEMGATRVVGVDRYASNLYDPDGDASGAYVRLLRAKGHVVPASTSAGRRKQQQQQQQQQQQHNQHRHAAVSKAAESLRAVFLPMDATRPIATQGYIDGLDERSGDRDVARALWALTPVAAVRPAQLVPYHGFAANPFDLATCMFAVHYFFESPATLATFARNVAAVLRPGGHLLGCCLDGRMVHEMLEREAPAQGDSVRGGSAEAPAWRITRRYDSYVPTAEGGKKTAEGGKKTAKKAGRDAAFGRRIDVYMESIGQEIPEFLFDHATLAAALAEVGMRHLEPAEAAALGLVGSASTGTFEALFEDMRRRHPNPKAPGLSPSIATSLAMTEDERRYSFLNRWFVFKMRGP